MKVTAKIKKTGQTVSADAEFGSNLADTVKIFGEQVCYTNLVGALKVSFQGWLRSQISGEKPKSPQEISAGAKTWKPGVKRAAKSPQEKLREMFGAMTADERAAFLKEHVSKKAA